MTKVTLSLQKATTHKEIPSSKAFKTWIITALETAGFVKACEINIRLVDEAESQTLNLQYRGKDKPTNVLSFASELPSEILDALKREPLGDMVICVPVMAREAQEQHKTATAHWAHLTIHSTLHLLGFDHIEEDEAKEMEALEMLALQKLGYQNPYLID
ncbi:MAG: rRNA maturation RNase YbeY [Moraxellaceae bacterium]|nr:rRNA maturation RNase YbeY [Pseudomonadales bacterium]MCP5175649.1 rRNA maturation RNase YbeY [Moraxellaceae bacterium]MCP5177751.1 rRNA maturation RNase YbeY [Moraxellaceae bacterium]HQV22142.1 rRNA maturation RNase YbeY [Agitococcus sp.]